MIRVVAFVTGAVVMILEIVGSRVIAPYLGTSILVWTSLIGIILASLSIGYWLGGKLADKSANTKTLAIIISVGGVFIGLIFFFKKILTFFSASDNDLAISAVNATLLLFAPATITLGMVTPYLARLSIKDVETSGRTVGNLYAISTLGSIIGTFLGGFILISVLGTGKILLTLSVTLFALAAMILIWKKTAAGISIIIFMTLLYSGISAVPPDYFKEEKYLVADIDTAYQRIWVFDEIDKRNGKLSRVLADTVLANDSAIYMESPNELVMDYMKMFDLAFHFNPNLKNALLIGGGVYSYPRHFVSLSSEYSIDVVEIDPDLSIIAKKYFAYTENPKINILHEDGRYYLNKSIKKYDVVYLDAFKNEISIPFQLTTVESLKQIDGLLDDDGVMITNIISPLEGNRTNLLRALYATYKEVFPEILVFQVNTDTPTDKAQNIIFVAVKSKEFTLKSDNETAQAFLDKKWGKEIAVDLPVLTDDFAPIEKYTAIVTIQ